MDRETKKMFPAALQQVVQVPFLRLNLIDFYNNNMGSVDVADQLRTFYRVDHWLRNRMWWWSIYWWGFQNLLTNSFLAYRSFMNIHGLRSLTHRVFIAAVTLKWLSDDRPTPLYYTPGGLVDDFNAERSGYGSDSKKRKCTTIIDESLSPSGKLAIRMINSPTLRHLPQSTNEADPYCQLRKRGGYVMYCEVCNINLCLGCFMPFHTLQTLPPHPPHVYTP